jgi:predicted transcriptional regulator
MAESVLKDLFPYFEDNSTVLSIDSIEELKEQQNTKQINPEVVDVVLARLKDKKQVDRVSLLKDILYNVSDETVKRATIQELVRLKSGELKDILSGYLKDNKTNTPSKVEAIRQLGKVAIRRYLERK